MTRAEEQVSGLARAVALAGVQERAAVLSDYLVVASEPGSGTQVRFRVPLEKENA